MANNRIDTCPICSGIHLIHQYTYTDYITEHPFEILQCCDCGLFITQNAPTSNDKSLYYPKTDSPLHPETKKGTINRAYRIFRSTWLKQKASIVEQQSHRVSGVLLDIGCKTGDFVNTMRHRGWIAHGLEYNPFAREYGYSRHGVKIEEQQKLLHIQPKSYNVVTAWDSIGEFEDLNKSFAAMCNLIVSDGTLIVAFPDVSSPAVRRYKDKWFSWDIPRKRWHFTPKTFELLAHNYDMQITEQKRYAKKSMGSYIMSEWLTNSKMHQTQSLLRGIFHEAADRIKSSEPEYIVYTLKHK